MTIEKIDADIAAWQRRCDNWLSWDVHAGGSDGALRGAQACTDEIEKLRRQRLELTEQTERK